MHLYLNSRGIQHETELWEKFMQSQFFPWKRKNLKTGKDEIIMVQGALRPLRFYEYVFPEECLPEVLANMGMTKEEVHMKGRNLREHAMLAVLRKAMNCKIIPDTIWQQAKLLPYDRMMRRPGVAVQPIGIKPDPRRANETWGYEQEML